MPNRIAVYPGSFDGPTLGHKHILSVAAALFDKVIVLVGTNPLKRGKYWFTPEERVAMMKTMVFNIKHPDRFQGRPVGHLGLEDWKLSVKEMGEDYTICAAEQLGADWIVRGIRSASDYEDEDIIANYNHDQNASIQTVLLPAPDYLKRISSSFVKNLVGYNGWQDEVEDYLPWHIVNDFIVRAEEIIEGE